MSKFIKLTEIRNVRNESPACINRQERIPILINTECIVKVEDHLIRMADFSIKIAETLEQIEEMIIDRPSNVP